MNLLSSRKFHLSPFINGENKDFWFRTRYIPALAARLSQQHPHVLELHLRPSTVASVIGSCVGLLPTFAQSWVKAAFPEWFLPSHVVLKKQKKGEGEEETIREEQFDTDVKAYDQLKPLQGTVIPTCYGRLRYDGTRALLLEYLGGVSMSLPEGTTLTLEELSALLQPCYEVLNAFSVHHDNPNLSNFQLVNGKIMALDLESAVFDMSADRRAYRGMQAYYRHDGSLEAA
ncbi:lipopolysaccharide core heptose(II) kinase RfaY [Parachaetomium inaequale]|uniref:Lipopolysaccharide core heptose(II) kinase RfaY n=1 Tax=Parachaetomium inaequale TaxID=2588326 RepID=A0AAN6PNK4_9PEZI|nr:lipopolysaccharide core heptose(II) kinase RfaY [Parachaetomium inaequale]